MREYEIKPHLQKILNKLSKKDKTAYEAVMKKIEQIINSQGIEHYENLQHDMSHLKEVHIVKSFVLVFSYDKAKDFVSFLDYEHHENIFDRR